MCNAKPLPSKLFGYLFVVVLFVSNVAADIVYPVLSGRVVDDAGLLSRMQALGIDALLAEHEAKTTNQVVVVTVPTLQGTSIEAYGMGLGNHWGIGRAGKNNGVLLLVAPNERKVRIEVGEGLERILTNAIAMQIIDDEILPRFKSEEYAKGIMDGVWGIMNALEGNYVSEDAPKPEHAGMLYLLIFAGVMVARLFGIRLSLPVAAVVAGVVGLIVWNVTQFPPAGFMIGAGVFLLIFNRPAVTPSHPGMGSYVDHSDVGSFTPGGGSFDGGGATGSW